YARSGINLHVDSTILVSIELMPERIESKELLIVGKAQTIDVGSSSLGTTINQDLLSRVAINRPGGKGSAMGSFESTATLAPSAQTDLYGVSIAGTTSPENAFIVDGVLVNNPSLAVLGTPLSVQFIKEVNIITGGYMPEYGKAIGGIYDVVTKSGS